MCDDRDYTVELIVQNLVDALIIDEKYLLVYAIVKPWYTRNKLVLAEEMVLRIAPGGNFGMIIQTLEDLAKEHDVDTISVGGALARSSRAIVRLYQRYGYVPETDAPQLTKRRR